ncbi:MAG TPA: LTA synthase family protein, partial [Bacillales bacterium]|nr:LTA synthase family protein [Bacillales bacterium]
MRPLGNDYNRSFFRRSFFIFFIVLGAKLILLRYLLFHFYQFTSAIWFDLSYLAVILAFIDLFVRKGRVVLYIAVDLLFSLICLSFVLYAGYFETLPSYYDLFQLDQAGTVGGSIILLLSPVYGLFFIDFIGFLFLPLVHKRLSGKSSSWKITGAVLAVGLVVIVSDFLVNQHEEIADPALFAADHGIMNFEVTRFTRNPAVSVAAEVDFTNQDILRLKGVVPVPTEQHVMFGKAKGKNLIVIQVESLQDFIIGKKINGQEITPNLNDLIHENYYFTNVFQQIGAGNTSDAEFMANTSYYPIGDKPTSETIVGTEIPSLPRLLGKVGYWSATFHTDELTYWNRDEMYPALGFDQFYEKPYFGNEDVVGHGASDEVLFNKSLDILLKKQQEEQLFYAHIITVTSHTPFKMPEDKQMLELPDKYKGTLVGNYFQAQHYTDYAIGKFVKSLKVTG